MSQNNVEREKFLVCAALPYANGPLHIGHLAGCYIPSDIYTRYRRLQGHDVHFLCGTDEHGAAITFLALRQGVSPQAIVDKYHEVLKSDLAAFSIDFDIFSRTTHPCHIKRSQEFFTNLKKNGLIETKTEKRLYCEKDQQFLPERYVVGECPNCHTLDARGDQCEKCGTWLELESLINPICQLCKVTKAVLRDTKHWYLSLNKLESKLLPWLESKASTWRKTVMGYAMQPIKAELAPRSITRDLDWGVPIPEPDTAGKVLYVWFDAPIGYISASEDWGLRENDPDRWKKYWEDPKVKLIHFIGKDNIVFHTVVWPSILIGDGRYPLPHLVAGNEFLNLEGEKISTSRNFAIWAGEAAQIVDPELLRYYLTKISPETSDSNFTWADFQAKVNSDLADIIGNLANRTLSFLNKNYEGLVNSDTSTPDSKVTEQIKQIVERYCDHLDQGFSKLALEDAIDLGRFLNGYLQESAPWKTRKTDPALAHRSLHATCLGIKALAVLLYPICPKIAGKIWIQLGFSDLINSRLLDECHKPFPVGHKISATVEPIVIKIEVDFVEAQRAKLEAVLGKKG